MSEDKMVISTHCLFCKNRQKNIFCDLHQSDVEYLNANKNHQFFASSELIFQEGGNPHGVYCISKGKIKITKLASNGKEQILRLVNAGEVIGYKSLLNNEAYQTTAVAIEPTEACFISKDVFVTLVQKNQKLTLNIMKVLVNDIHKADDSRLSLAQKSLRERVAESLLILKRAYGFQEDGQTLDLIISRIELANLVGTATESVIRFLSEFQKDEIIALEQKKIKIVNLPKLQRLANVED